MKKIFLIIRREYLTRVKKRSFIVMTILGPLLMAAMVIIPVYLSTMSNETKNITVLDETGFFYGKFKDSDNIRFHYVVSDLNTSKENFDKSGDYALLYIPKTELSVPSSATLYASGQVNMNVKSYIRNIMSKQVEELKLEAKIQDLKLQGDSKATTTDILKSIQASVNIETIKIGKQGKEEKSYPEVSMVLAMFSGILIYMFIFMFGAQVMRGIIEEKTSRIVEVILSSVKPFQLMMGKIVGVAMVGLTQFLLWVILTTSIITVGTSFFMTKTHAKATTDQIMKSKTAGVMASQVPEGIVKEDNDTSTNEIFDAISSIDFPVMIGAFLFYFLFGYLLYAALFASVGSAVDSEADTQQFMLPITIPLVFSFIMAQFIIQEPTGPLAFWLSMIPLTSPVIMMIRIPYGVPYFQLVLSMVLLILGFIGTTWMAAKIYKTGILMYGKKPSYRELWKWIRY